MVKGTGIETISVIYDWKVISLWNNYVIDMCTETRGYTVYATLVFIQWLLHRKRTERVYSWLVRSHYVWFYIQVRYRGDSSGMMFMKRISSVGFILRERIVISENTRYAWVVKVCMS